MTLFTKSSILFAFFLVLPLTVDAARVRTSGCEFQGDAPGTMTDNLEFQDVGGSPGTINATIKRTGLSSCRAASSGADTSQRYRSIVVNSGTASAAAWRFRTYLYIASLPSENANIISFMDTGVDSHEGGVVLNTAGTLSYNDDDGTIVATGSTVLSTATWYRIEVLYDGATAWGIQINGVSEISGGAHDGDSIDALQFGLCAAAEGGIACGADSSAAGDLYFDDIALNDTTGTTQTGFPGAGSVVHMQPDGVGDNSGCGAGTFASVDEITPDDAGTICTLVTNLGGDILDTTVESSTNAGIGSTDTVKLIQVGIRESAASAATETWALRIKSASGGTTSAGASNSHNDATYTTNGDPAVSASSPGVYTLTSYTDPTTAVAWTPTGTNSLDNMQIGVTNSDGNPDVRVSTLWAVVEFIPAAGGADPQSGPAHLYLKNSDVYLKNGSLYIKQ